MSSRFTTIVTKFLSNNNNSFPLLLYILSSFQRRKRRGLSCSCNWHSMAILNSFVLINSTILTFFKCYRVECPFGLLRK